MKIPSVGWAFFALTVVVLVGYLLNRGIYIGSEIRRTSYGYAKFCHYLHLNGSAVRNPFMSDSTPENAEQKLCSMLDG